MKIEKKPKIPKSVGNDLETIFRHIDALLAHIDLLKAHIDLLKANCAMSEELRTYEISQKEGYLFEEAKRNGITLY